MHHLLRLRIASGRLGCWSHRFDFRSGRFIRPAFVGLIELLIDRGVLYILYDRLNLGLTRSAMAAAEVAIIHNFLWNDCWTVQDFSRQQGIHRLAFKRLLKFNVICLTGLILKIFLLNLLFSRLHLNPYLGNFLAIAAVALWNFWINLKLNWRITQVR